MKSIGAYEAKTRLSAILDDVENGEQVTITKNGRPVAILRPVNGATTDVDKIVAAIHDFSKSHRLGSLSIRKLVEEGRD